jgi:hypothetical protein
VPDGPLEPTEPDFENLDALAEPPPGTVRFSESWE